MFVGYHLHGGFSIGANTLEGRVAIAESNRRRAKKRGAELIIPCTVEPPTSGQDKTGMNGGIALANKLAVPCLLLLSQVSS
jgi:hypothetical protein